MKERRQEGRNLERKNEKDKKKGMEGGMKLNFAIEKTN